MGGAGAPDLMETCRVPQRCVYLPHPFVPCMLETLSPYKGFSSLLPLLLGSSAPSQALEAPEAISLSHYFWNPSAPHKTRTRVSKYVTLKAVLYTPHLLALVPAYLPKPAPLSPDF